MAQNFAQHRWFHPLLLLIWIVIGASLRCTQLASKPPWTDEFSTLMASLGQSFQTVPLDQVISLERLLQPLRLNPQAGASLVIQHLLTEDVHPPLYFVLAHWWLRLFPTNSDVELIWAARSLPAFLGTISIPALFFLGRLAFRSTLVAQMAAAMMAVSPLAVFLAQEARHYTLAILWVIASLGCLMMALRCLARQIPLPIWLSCAWVGINALGMATHYFFILTLCAQALVLLVFCLAQIRAGQPVWQQPAWRRLCGPILGTAIALLAWLPIWITLRSSSQTQWLQTGNHMLFLQLINPICQSLAAWVTMLFLLPVESTNIWVVVGSGAAMLAFLVWLLPVLHRGLSAQQSDPDAYLSIQGLGGFVLGAIAIFFAITYGLGADLTRGARYSFVYFPAVVVLIGASLATYWRQSSLGGKLSRSLGLQAKASSTPSPFILSTLKGRQIVTLVWFMGLAGSLTVVSNLGYQKYYRPDQMMPLLQNHSQNSVLIATTHHTLVQVGEMMGLAWEWRSQQRRGISSASNTPAPQFLLAHEAQNPCLQDCFATQLLHEQVEQLLHPLDVWLVNFHAPAEFETDQTCQRIDLKTKPYINGYAYEGYHCS
ncbi:MAG: glycosyltransferase [Cyanothece sp. SIO1E1]|nr:glycosyltransferase [Cyanothece sp. SIO1E1]